MGSTSAKTDIPTIRLGTRGSPLALYQANLVRSLLLAHWHWPETAVEIVIIETSGDKILDRPLYDVGGKGLFIKAIEEALLDGRVDIAVHSMKDVPSILDDGLAIAAILEREDPRDALIAPGISALLDLPLGTVFGTSSPRRRAQLRRLRPDLIIRDLRGNVDTRLGRVREGVVQATILAAAGLNRLGKADVAACIVPIEQMLPAAAQGAIGVEIRQGDDAARALLAPINHAPSAIAAHTERAVLAALGGSCITPVAAHARISGDVVHLSAMLSNLEGTEITQASETGNVADHVQLGWAIGTQLARSAPAGALD